MTAKLRALIVLSIVFLLLIGLTIVLLVGPPSGEGDANRAETDTGTEMFAITDIPVESLATIAITNEYGGFGILNSPGGIELISDVTGNYSETEMRALVYIVCNLTGSHRQDDLPDAEQLGLDKPLSRITLTLTDGAMHNFAVLRESAVGDGYLLFSEDDQAVFLISADEAAFFMRKAEDFFSHMIFPMVTSADFDKVKTISLTFETAEKAYTITRREGAFYLTEPVDELLSDVTVLEQILLPLSALYGDEIIATGADLAEYGFDDYTVQISMDFDGKTYTALLKKKEDGTLLMANPDDGSIYRLSEDDGFSLFSDYSALVDSLGK